MVVSQKLIYFSNLAKKKKFIYYLIFLVVVLTQIKFKKKVTNIKGKLFFSSDFYTCCMKIGCILNSHQELISVARSDAFPLNRVVLIMKHFFWGSFGHFKTYFNQSSFEMSEPNVLSLLPVQKYVP